MQQRAHFFVYLCQRFGDVYMLRTHGYTGGAVRTSTVILVGVCEQAVVNPPAECVGEQLELVIVFKHLRDIHAKGAIHAVTAVCTGHGFSVEHDVAGAVEHGGF